MQDGVRVDDMADCIRNNMALNRFEIDVESSVAAADYALAPGVITFTPTEVRRGLPAEATGRSLCTARWRLRERQTSRSS
jgi:hypothetical protein